MTNEEAKEIFLNRGYIQVKGGRIYDGDKWRESVVVISKWLEQEPCDDAISREAVIEHYNSGEILQCNHVSRNNLLNYIEALPPVTPKPKTGYWIDDEFGSKCSCCGIYTHLDKFDRPMKFKYCSNCGAKMLPTDSEKE
jgi:hypothetical protein